MDVLASMMAMSKPMKQRRLGAILIITLIHLKKTLLLMLNDPSVRGQDIFILGGEKISLLYMKIT